MRHRGTPSRHRTTVESVSEDHRYVVIGAGAIGGTVGAVLSRSGVPAILVARGAHAEALRDDGIVLHTPDGTVRVPVLAASAAQQISLTVRDVLVFTTKTQQLDAALVQWADRPVYDGDRLVGTAGALLPVLTALNGVAAEEKALRYFRRVFGVCVWMPAVHLQPGAVIVRSWPVTGQFHVARWPAQLHTADDDRLLCRIAHEWTAAGIQIRLPENVAPWKYNKLLSNLANVIDALCISDSDNSAITVAVRREGEAVLRQAGIAFVDFTASGAVRADGPTPRPVPGAPQQIASSTWQSLTRNTGNVETDFLNGEIVRLAHHHGITAPLNATLASLMRQTCRDGSGPGVYSAAELAALLGLS